MSATRYQVFAAITPGFEEALAEEVKSLGLSERPTRARGGVECRLSAEGMWRFALESRLAESLRARIGRFRAPTFEALTAGARKLPWSAYLPRGLEPTISVTCKRSALYHSDAVAERISKVLAERLQIETPSSSPESVPRVFVRLVRDMATVSVDVTGESLHRRGYRSHVGKAPLRETLAAAILWAGDLRGESIWDPLCGSGTIPLEALALAAHRKNLGRAFAFERWPTHSAERWERLVSSLGPTEPVCVQMFGSDIEPREISAAEHNTAQAGYSANVSFSVGDFEAVAEKIPENVAICTNFPYGHRIGDKRSLRSLGRRFARLLTTRRDISKVVVLCGHRSFERDTTLDWELLGGFRNRGLPVRLLRLRRES